jgi:hypothetical protein
MSGPGSRFIILGVLFFVLSLAIIGWSYGSEWVHQAQRQAGPPTEVLPERFDVPATPVIRATRVAP